MSGSFEHWSEAEFDAALEAVTSGAVGTAPRAESGADYDLLERTAAAVHLAFLAPIERPPAEVLDRLHARTRGQMGRPPRPRPLLAHPAWGWLAAAGLVAALAWRSGPVEAPRGGSDLVARVEASPSARRFAWTATADELAHGASGEVVWDATTGEGAMRFHGLRANDPAHEQYQLWIFDASRAAWEQHPVDGGVFDVDASGDAVVAIDPKLDVRDARLFAITLEAPGGVVVSEREHLLLTAEVKG